MHYYNLMDTTWHAQLQQHLGLGRSVHVDTAQHSTTIPTACLCQDQMRVLQFSTIILTFTKISSD